MSITTMTAQPAMPMLGEARGDTFMGVRPCASLNELDADVVVLGAPCATPYPGAPDYAQANLGAPQAIRKAMAFWAGTKDRFDWDLGQLPMSGLEERVCDLGDLSTDLNRPNENRDLIRQTITTIVAEGAIPIVIGGDDSVPVPIIEGLSAKDPVTILQIDAHIDWRDQIDGERNGLSSVMRRASEQAHVANIIQVGARGLSSAGTREIADAKAWGARFFTARDVFHDGVQPILDSIPNHASVHINLDFDGLDPSIMPAVFVPAPGGLLYWHAVELILGVIRKAHLCSFAAVELVPGKDISGNSALTAGRLVSLTIGAALHARYAKDFRSAVVKTAKARSAR